MPVGFVMHGVSVADGIAIGRAHLFAQTPAEVTHYEVPSSEIEAEVLRFDGAIEAVRKELLNLKNHVPVGAPPEFKAFLELHLLILNDGALSQTPSFLIRQQGCNAEWALKQQMDSLIEQFEQIEDTYLRERQADVKQVSERIIKFLSGQGTAFVPSEDGAERILVARDLSPADMMEFKQHSFQAFITDLGGATSHTAILARSLSIPSVVALHHAWSSIREGEWLIVDGEAGVVMVNPDPLILSEYRLRQELWLLEAKKLARLRTTPSKTLDGVAIQLWANIESPADIAAVHASGATGIGLYRSEFLFMNRLDLPSEEEQFLAYRTVAEAMGQQPVTIRTLDIGADKTLDNSNYKDTLNPALGLRAIRYCLTEPRLFITQLRAILRASYYGNVHLLLPMLTHPHEVEQALHLLDQARAELRQQNHPFDEKIPIGGMIEVPAAALSLSHFLPRLDFISIGTNDLIQYTLAIDRADDEVAHLYDPLHPAIIYLVSQTIQQAKRAGVKVAICGEMAGDRHLTRLLLGFGLEIFSMHPNHIPYVKKVVLSSALSHLNPGIKKIQRTHNSTTLRRFVDELNQLIC